MLGFRPLSGTYSSHQDLEVPNEWEQIIVSVPFRGPILLIGEFATITETELLSFRPLSGTYSSHRDTLPIYKFAYVLFPSPFGDLFFSSKPTNTYPSLSQFPSPFGDLFFSSKPTRTMIELCKLVSVPFRGPILLIAFQLFYSVRITGLFPSPFGDLFFSSNIISLCNKFESFRPLSGTYSSHRLKNSLMRGFHASFRPLSGTYSSHQVKLLTETI